MQTFQGIPVSGGSVIAPIVLVLPPQPLPDEPVSVDRDADLMRVKAALESVAVDLEHRAASLEGDARAMVEAAVMVARDPGLVEAVEESLSCNGPAHALHAAVEFYAEQFVQLGGYFAERVTDLRDVGARAEAVLLGRPAPGVPELTEPSIVVAEDLAPAETAAMDPALVLGLVTQGGGRTSHTEILAAQRGIPAIVKAAGVLDLAPGTRVALDGDQGRLVVDPDADLIADLETRRQRRQRIHGVSGPGRTADGHAVALLANIGGVADAEAAGSQDVEGVGLFRTEFVYLDAQKAPSVAEQTEIYAAVLEPFDGRPVTVRTLDAGADKPLAFADLGPEPNPALGRRGLRLMREREDLLDEQLAALAAARGRTGALVKVMAPMVATAGEARWFAERAHAAGLPVAGTMIEVPAAALRARQVLRHCDFASLGTNDLAQYAMAADRMVGELSELLDPFQPAVLDLVAAACDGGRETGKPVGVCGESAGDPLLALVLVGLGVTSLSMSPGRVPMVRYALSLHTTADCRTMAETALSAENAQAARTAVTALTKPELRELL